MPGLNVPAVRLQVNEKLSHFHIWVSVTVLWKAPVTFQIRLPARPARQPDRREKGRLKPKKAGTSALCHQDLIRRFSSNAGANKPAALSKVNRNEFGVTGSVTPRSSSRRGKNILIDPIWRNG